MRDATKIIRSTLTRSAAGEPLHSGPTFAAPYHTPGDPAQELADVINRAKSVDPAALQKAANETNMGPEQLIIDYKGIRFENGQNVLATGVVTQVGWDGEKHTLWPWDLATRANFKPIFPSPTWQERESKPKPAN